MTLSGGNSHSVQVQTLAALLLTALVSGCAAQHKPPLYRWGDYQTLIYQQYVQPGKAEPNIQVDKLSADIQKTQAEGKRVPPGEHAQLGYMEYQIGNANQAAAQFAIERKLYPESSVFMTTILKRLHAGDTQ